MNPHNYREPEYEVDAGQRRTFWRVIAGLWVSGALIIAALYKKLFGRK